MDRSFLGLCPQSEQWVRARAPEPECFRSSPCEWGSGAAEVEEISVETRDGPISCGDSTSSQGSPGRRCWVSLGWERGDLEKGVKGLVS